MEINSFKTFLKEAIAIDKINTTPGKKEVAVFAGRMQPPTAGHLKAIKAAYKKYHKKIVIVLIKGANSDVKFDSKTQKEVFSKMLSDVPHMFLDADNGFMGEWVHQLRNDNYEPIALYCGSDRVKSYQGMIKRYEDKLNINIKVEEIARTGKDISASKVRQALKDDDYKTFKDNMDKRTWDLFDKLKKMV